MIRQDKQSGNVHSPELNRALVMGSGHRVRKYLFPREETATDDGIKKLAVTEEAGVNMEKLVQVGVKPTFVLVEKGDESDGEKQDSMKLGEMKGLMEQVLDGPIAPNKDSTHVAVMEEDEQVQFEQKGQQPLFSDGANKEIVVEALARKKVRKWSTVIVGVSYKKRMVLALISPKKRGGTKTNIHIGDGLYPGKPRKELGTKEEQLPPKQDIN